MNPAKQLKMNIQTCEIPHAAFEACLTRLEDRIADAQAGMPYHIEAVVGPSRVGKTRLMEALTKMNPETKVDGRRVLPVLPVALPALVSPKELPKSVLDALGVPVMARARHSDMTSRSIEQLDRAENRVILVEEASHSVENSSRIDPYAVADWWKSFAERRNATVIFFGVPRLLRLFESNEQLRMRASKPIEFRPYNWRTSREQEAFGQCVLTYVKLFKDAGWPIAIDLTSLVCNSYLFSGGTVGVLSKLMEEVANNLRDAPFREVTFSDFQVAATNVPSAGDPAFPAFAVPGAVSPMALMSAHTSLLKRYGWTPRTTN